MEPLKKRIPNETALRMCIEQLTPTFLKTVKDKVGHLEAELIRLRRQSRWGSAAIFIGAAVDFAAFHPEFGSPALENHLVLFFSIPIIIITLFYGVRNIGSEFGKISKFDDGINKLMFTQAFNLLGISKLIFLDQTDTRWKDESEKSIVWPVSTNPPAIKQITLTNKTRVHHSAIAEAHLDESELITDEKRSVFVDNVLSGEYGGRELFLAELKVNQPSIMSGDKSVMKQTFKGCLVSFGLSRPLEGKTFISTEGDTSDVGHRSFWGRKLDGHV